MCLPQFHLEMSSENTSGNFGSENPETSSSSSSPSDEENELSGFIDYVQILKQLETKWNELKTFSENKALLANTLQKNLDVASSRLAQIKVKEMNLETELKTLRTK